MDLQSLPRCMAERGLWARKEFINNPKDSQVDDECLVWVYNNEDGLWYSIGGNYSRFSPQEKGFCEDCECKGFLMK